MRTVHFRDLGSMDYQAAWDYQTSLLRTLVDNKLTNRSLPAGSYPQDHQLLFVEHPPVYTLGKSGSMDHLLLSETDMQQRGIQFFPINRGGDITFHGPGQIVGYPILDLECFFTDVHRYVRSIEEVVIRTLAEYGIQAYRIKEYTGVWVCRGRELEVRSSKYEVRDGSVSLEASGEVRSWELEGQRKICAIGVHLSRWVTLHGFAFNINTPLEYFDYIIPCGIADKDKSVTSLARELGREVNMEEVKEKIRRHFAEVFECDITI